MRRLVLLIALLGTLISGCTEKRYVTGDNIYLSFSTDTIHFDTVFTDIGTATRELRVVNRNSGWIKLDLISTGNGSNSAFRLNIDGVSGNSAANLEIPPGDSLFIFVDAVIDPNNLDNPIAIHDSILFSFHGKEQDVNLLAWGQDIILIDGEKISTETWSGSKPYVVYNSIMIDTGEVLTIDPGVRVLFHRGSTMYIGGTLIVNGSDDDMILFSSDRIEPMYEDIPGQWNGLYFLNGSSSNIINNAIIRNSVSAIHLGNLGSQDPAPDLAISNSLIMHNTISGISSIGADISVQNCVISHCGYYSLFLVMGGSHNFLHCTVDNNWDYSARISPGVIIADYFEYDESVYEGLFTESLFSNCVITGSLNNEVGIFALNESDLGCRFNSCLLDVDSGLDMWNYYDLSSSLINRDPTYISPSAFDFRPDTLSPLIDMADPAFSILSDTDLRGFSRFEDNGPDIGAYERQVGETSR